ncbi:MAG: DUF1361 domain-containing protein [Microcoleaceae cyanobacterium]
MILILIHWINAAWLAISTNVGWMSWNLFLALIPLALSFWLFNPHGLSSLSIKQSPLLLWGVGLLLALSVFPHIPNVLRFLGNITQILDWKYLIAVILVTTALIVWEFLSSARSLGWWIVFLMFIFFLPNAPYVLTDVIHLVEDIRFGYSIWIISLALIPQYLVFMLLGFGAYILCLIQLERYFQAQGWGIWNKGIELLVQFLCAIGIYLGRFQRFNTWDILTRPNALIESVIQDILNQRPLLIIAVTFVVLSLLSALLKPVTLAVLSSDYEPSHM